MNWIDKFNEIYAAKNVMEEAERLYLTDAEFYAKVNLIAEVYRGNVQLEAGEDPDEALMAVAVVNIAVSVYVLDEILKVDEARAVGGNGKLKLPN